MKNGTHSDAGSARILLIDDNHSGLLVRKTILEESGYIITIANSPQEGLSSFASAAFDLVITDFRMPTMNGREVIEQIRTLRPEIPIILISGVVDALGLNEQNTGADAVVAKNNMEQLHLTRAVNRLLKSKIAKKPVKSQAGTTRARSRIRSV